jgi:hypothetical protein
MPKLFVALALLASIPTVASAQQRSGTAQEQNACARDVSRHCRKLMDQGDFVVLACLKENRAKLSAACNQVLINHNQ